METLKAIVRIFAVIGTVILVRAQLGNAVALNINLFPVQTIAVNGENRVDMIYKNQADYSNGVSVMKENHLKINSTGGFIVKVKADQDHLTSDNSEASPIQTSDITLMATKGTSNNLEEFITQEVSLSQNNVDLFSSNRGGVNKYFNIQYNGANGNKWHNKITGGEGNQLCHSNNILHRTKISINKLLSNMLPLTIEVIQC